MVLLIGHIMLLPSPAVHNLVSASEGCTFSPSPCTKDRRHRKAQRDTRSLFYMLVYALMTLWHKPVGWQLEAGLYHLENTGPERKRRKRRFLSPKAWQFLDFKGITDRHAKNWTCGIAFLFLTPLMPGLLTWTMRPCIFFLLTSWQHYLDHFFYPDWFYKKNIFWSWHFIYQNMFWHNPFL